MISSEKSIVSKSKFWVVLRKTIVVCFAVIGAFALLIYSFQFMRGQPEPGYIVSSTFSPDKKYKAVLFNKNGGGAISPYCFDFISVVPGSVAGKAAYTDRSIVYRGGCCTFYDSKTNSFENGPEIKWLSNNRLQITFSTTESAMGIREMTLKGHSESGNVTIVYKTREKGVPNIRGEK